MMESCRSVALALHVLVLLIWALCMQQSAALKAGVAKVDATLPVGVPLAGFSARKTKFWPIPRPTKYTTFMEPSVGHLDPTWTKALVLKDDDGTELCIITFDGIGADGALRKLAYYKAAVLGFPLPLSNVIMSGSHSHSGPGAVSPEFLWEFAPATDLIVPELQNMVAEKMAEAMMTAYKQLAPASAGIGVSQLFNVTKNRRAGVSPFLKPTDIDPNMAIISVDSADGKPLATVWNFAIHGTCLGSKNLNSSADIMGAANAAIESLVGGTALFINADAGDIAPTGATCDGNAERPHFAGADIIAAHVKEARSDVMVYSDLQLQLKSQLIDFGLTDLNLTLARVQNCSSGGPLDICGICEFLNCDLHLRLDSSWVEEMPRFTAVKFVHGSNTDILVTVPGEALSGLGFEIRADMKKLGFDSLVLAGYSNDHMGYFATVQEYDVGGYESLLTFWGSGTAEKIRQSCSAVASALAP
eukprot:scpid74991/ scgid33716/ Neutral ceramidase B; Acylsphingosine deacylase 2B; N-acylsphingosine amidohydrolase 2B